MGKLAQVLDQKFYHYKRVENNRNVTAFTENIIGFCSMFFDIIILEITAFDEISYTPRPRYRRKTGGQTSTGSKVRR